MQNQTSLSQANLPFCSLLIRKKYDLMFDMTIPMSRILCLFSIIFHSQLSCHKPVYHCQRSPDTQQGLLGIIVTVGKVWRINSTHCAVLLLRFTQPNSKTFGATFKRIQNSDKTSADNTFLNPNTPTSALLGMCLTTKWPLGSKSTS